MAWFAGQLGDDNRCLFAGGEHETKEAAAAEALSRYPERPVVMLASSEDGKPARRGDIWSAERAEDGEVHYTPLPYVTV